MTRDDIQPLAHQDAWELIPWYVNGTLGTAETVGFEAHLQRCPLCQREVAVNRELAVAVRDAGELPSAEAGLERVLERLDEAPGRGEAPPAPRRGAGRLLPSWWSAAPRPARRLVAAQLAAVLLLALTLGVVLSGGGPGTSPPASFRTLSSPRPAAADTSEGFRVRLLFSPQVTEPELRHVLLTDGGRLVGGPSPAGVYTALYPAAADVAAVLKRLRGNRGVELAELVARAAAVPEEGR